VITVDLFLCLVLIIWKNRFDPCTPVRPAEDNQSDNILKGSMI